MMGKRTQAFVTVTNTNVLEGGGSLYQKGPGIFITGLIFAKALTEAKRIHWSKDLLQFVWIIAIW